jgi:hypothetical protein
MFEEATQTQLLCYIANYDTEHIILNKKDLYVLINRTLLFINSLDKHTKERFDILVKYYYETFK